MKVTRPSTMGLVFRERLFGTLDEALDGRCIWMSAPGGSGKTSLVSTWLDHARVDNAWYQVDAGDGDPATLFHYLRLDAESLDRSGAVALPRFEPAMFGRVDVFARRFFEVYFGSRTTPFVLVFDNYQEVRGESPFHVAMGGALSALPAGSLIVCISRDGPPPALARWFADPGFIRLEADALRLTDDEARRVAGPTHTPGEEVDAMNLQARGWAAGFRLLLRARMAGLDWETARTESTGSLFDYFTTEVFRRMEPDVQRFLLSTAFLPTVTAATGRALSGYDGAAQRLAAMHRDRLFTDRRQQSAGVSEYEYHPLFRAFLLQRARASLPVETVRDLQRRAATLMVDAGRIDAAARMWGETEDWYALRELVREHAPALLAGGRIDTLRDWLAVFPITFRDGDMWLLYWFGTCESFRDVFAGRVIVEGAYHRLIAAGETEDASRALAQVILSFFFAWVDAVPLDRWIAEFEALFDRFDGVLPAAVEGAVLGACMGIMYRRPDHPMLPALARRAQDLALSMPDSAERLGVAAFAVLHHLWKGDVSRARALADEIDARPDQFSAASLRVHFGIMRSVVLWQDGEFAAATATIERSLDVARRFGMPIFEFATQARLVEIELGAGNLDAAERALDACRALIDPMRVADVQHYRFWRAAALLLRGRVDEAAAVARDAAAPGLDAGSPYLEAVVLRTIYGQVLMMAGEHEAAREHLGKALAFGQHMNSDAIRFPAFLALAWSHLRTGDDATGDHHLRKGLAIGERQGYRNAHSLWIPSVIAELCGYALKARIEPAYVKRLVRSRALPPPSSSIEEWPWPVLIQTLGRFTLVIDDRPLVVTGKAQKKPLHLLQTIVAAGRAGIAVTTVVEQLWDELDGDAGRNALDIALHRLRRMIGRDDVLALRNGRLLFEAHCIWVDAWAFEELCEAIDGMARMPADADIDGFARPLLRLYAGPFLIGEDIPSAIGARERLRSKFLRAIGQLAFLLEERRRWEEAIALHRRAVEVDPLVEQFHCGLMRNYRAQGRIAEALDTYRHCRELLSIVLGIEPSAATQAEYRALRSG